MVIELPVGLLSAIMVSASMQQRKLHILARTKYLHLLGNKFQHIKRHLDVSRS